MTVCVGFGRMLRCREGKGHVQGLASLQLEEEAVQAVRVCDVPRSTVGQERSSVPELTERWVAGALMGDPTDPSEDRLSQQAECWECVLSCLP